MSGETLIRDLFDASWREVAARTDSLTGKPVEMRLPDAPSLLLSTDPEPQLPVLGHLDEAVTVARSNGFASLMDRFEAARPHLRWSQNEAYVRDNPDNPFLSGYAFAILSSAGGPLVCDVPLCGFILIGPDVHYPAHHHTPSEIYLLMGPGIRWQLDHGEWFDTAPGDLIFHDGWRVHATRTANTPMLAFVSWLDKSERDTIRWAMPSE